MLMPMLGALGCQSILDNYYEMSSSAIRYQIRYQIMISDIHKKKIIIIFREYNLQCQINVIHIPIKKFLFSRLEVITC